MKVQKSLRIKVNKLVGIVIFTLFLVFSLQVNCLAEWESVIDDRIARGIYLQKNHHGDYQGGLNRSITEYIISADLNDPTVKVISGKGQDMVLGLETLSAQIAREQNKGQQVVAGINGDVYNISTGTPHYGAPQGIQVKDGNILVGFASGWDSNRYPVFAIDKKNQPIIGYFTMDNQLSLVEPGYELRYGSANPGRTVAIDSINRNNPEIMADQMVLLTPQLAENPVVGFSDIHAAHGTLTVLRNLTGYYGGSIKLGQCYEAEVVSIGDTATGPKQVTIPADGMVLASQGIKATWVKENLKPGDRVRFSFNIKDQAGNILDLQQAVSAWLPLVENGQALTLDDMLEKCKDDWNNGTAMIKGEDKARTAIGYTLDNKVIALVVDGGGAARDSYGLDLPGMAKRMQELGCVAAVSLDGGGSTQMNARLFGETEVLPVNQPSDEKERLISNSILFLSDAPKTNDLAELKVKQAIHIFKNTSYTFQVRGQDSNGNPVDLENMDIRWSIEPFDNNASFKTSGTIDNQGRFVAGDCAAKQMVQASLASSAVTGRVEVNVVDSVHYLGFTDSGILAVEPDAPRQLQITASTEEGKPIVIANDAVQWSVSPSSIASIDNQGVLTPVEKGVGVVKARVGEREAAINFVSGLERQTIDSFEEGNTGAYYVNGYVGGSCRITTEEARDGQHSLRVDYDYSGWSKVYNGTINVCLDPGEKGTSYTSDIRPDKLGMWVFGDGKAPWLRAMIKDGNGNNHTVNLVPKIDWVGWKYISTDIPADIPTPITLDYFYMVEIDKSKNLKGTVYFDDLQFVYSEQAETVTGTVPNIELKAVSTPSTVLVNGELIAFEAYNINDYNYFKLRDLALVLRGTDKQFEVEWDDANRVIKLFSNQPYTVIGGELAQGDNLQKNPIPNTCKIYKDGIHIYLTAYNIDGYNYFKLRNIAQLFDFGVTWDSNTNTVSINTSTGYDY
jgi:hypothetical protein